MPKDLPPQEFCSRHLDDLKKRGLPVVLDGLNTWIHGNGIASSPNQTTWLNALAPFIEKSLSLSSLDEEALDEIDSQGVASDTEDLQIDLDQTDQVLDIHQHFLDLMKAGHSDEAFAFMNDLQIEHTQMDQENDIHQHFLELLEAGLDDEAFAFMEEAMPSVSAFEPSEGDLLGLIEMDGSTTTESLAKIAEFLETRTKSLHEMHAVTNDLNGPLIVRWESGIEELSKLFFGLTSAIKVALLAIVEPSEPSRGPLSAQLSDVLTLISRFDHMPLAITMLCKSACLTSFLPVLSHILNKTALPQRELETLTSHISSCWNSNLLSRYLIGERCYYLGPEREEERDYKNLAFYLVALQKRCAAAELPYPERAIALAKLDSQVSESDTFNESGDAPSWVLAECNYTMLTHADLQIYRTVLLCKTVLAIERRRGNGHGLPLSLEDLVPDYIDELPLDPVTGQSLQYEVDVSGYSLRAVPADESTSENDLNEKNRVSRRELLRIARFF
jgi:hypothetical protein